MRKDKLKKGITKNNLYIFSNSIEEFRLVIKPTNKKKLSIYMSSIYKCMY